MQNIDYFLKWEELDIEVQKRSDNEVITKYLSLASSNNVFVSNSDNGDRAFLVEFSKDILQNYKVKKVNGISIEIKENDKINKDKTYMVFSNVDKNLDTAFISFSTYIFDSLVDTKDEKSSVEKIEEAIEKHHDFFGFKNKLSKENEQGLIAELIYLDELIKRYGDVAVHYWQGSEKNKRDFVIENTGVEIKSTRNQEQDIIHVSNENQLDPTGLDRLLLKLYTLEENELGHNVKYYIDLVGNEIVSYEAKKAFNAKLMLREIDPEKYEAGFNFNLISVHTYLVDDKFPKITKQSIPACAYDVKYSLNLSGMNYIEKE